MRSGFAFGRFEYDDAQAKLLLAGREVPLTARELHLLVIFLSRPGEWLEAAWMERGLWPKAVPPTGELDRLVRALTAALDEGADGVATIQKVTGRGYRLLIPVRPLDGAAVDAAHAAALGGGARPARPASGERPGVGESGTPAAGAPALASPGSPASPGSSASGELAPALPAGRSAHRRLVSAGQLVVGLLVLAALTITVLWLVGPPSRPGAGAREKAAGAPDTAAMRAAAAAELGKGIPAARGFDFTSRRAAITHFEAALQLDSGARNQAAAHAALANVLVLEGEMERARLEAQAALASNIALGVGAQLAEPLAALAFTQLFLARDPVAARATAGRVLALDALHVGGRRALVWVCVVEGRFDAARQELGPLRNGTAFEPEVATDEAWLLYLSGRALEARQLLATIVRREPLFRRAHAALAALNLTERRLAAAAVELELLDALEAGATGEDERVRLLTSGGWAMPDAGEAARLLEERADGAGKKAQAGALGAEIEAARIFAQFGRNAEAMAALARALERRESDAVLARIDPAFAPLRGTAAFRKLLDGAGVPELAAPAR